VGSSSMTPRPPCPSTNPVTTNSAVSDRKLRCARPDSSAPPISTAPNTVAAVAKDIRAGSVSADQRARGGERRVRVRKERGGRRLRITVLGKSPSWQDAGGACSGYLVEEAGTF